MDTNNLPLINSIFNTLSAICLLAGFVAIKKEQKEIHKKFMVSALIFSSFFLAGYLVYHYNHGSSVFPDLGWIKTLYLIILVPHIILAAVMVPLIAMTFYFAFSGKFERHKKWARITFPIWMYVSVTGIVIYLMVHQWFKV